MRTRGFFTSRTAYLLLLLILLAPAVGLPGQQSTVATSRAAFQVDGTPESGELPPSATVPLSLAALFDPAYAGVDLGLPPGVMIEPLAGGIAAQLVDGPGVLQMDRVVVAPGELVDVTQQAGPSILFVESGTLTFIDEIGLEAQAVAGAQQFLEDGSAYAVRNDTTDQGTLLWLRYVPSVRPAEDGSGQDLTFTVQTIKLYDGSVYPETVTIPANVPVSVVIENDGSVLHNFTIDDLSISTGDISNNGGSQQITIVAPDGIYQFYDSNTGASGTLIVASAGAPMTAAESDDASATPPATTSLATPPDPLLVGDVPVPPSAPVLLFLMRVELDPGADFGEQTLNGPVGFVAEAGTTTVLRPGRLPAQLQPGQRAGRVVFPTNYTSQETNVGSEPASVLVAGIVTANQALLMPASAEEVIFDEGDDDSSSGGTSNETSGG